MTGTDIARVIVVGILGLVCSPWNMLVMLDQDPTATCLPVVAWTPPGSLVVEMPMCVSERQPMREVTVELMIVTRDQTSERSE